MSERGIMFLVVAALFGGAFLFPYENDDSSYVRQPKPPAPPKQPTGPTAEVTGPRAVEIPGPTDGKFNVASNNMPLTSGARLPSPETTMRQVAGEQGQSLSQRDGFPEGQWLEGTWVQITDNSDPDSTREPVSEPASITFHVDGTFTEHQLLSDGKSTAPVEKQRADIRGKYRLAEFTLTVVKADEVAGVDSVPSRPQTYSACPLVGENTRGLPIRIFVDGKVLKYRD